MTFLSGKSLSFFSPSMPPQLGPEVTIVCCGALCRMAAASRALSLFHSSSRRSKTGSLMISRMVSSGSKRASRAASAAPEADKGLLPGRVEFRRTVFVVNVDHHQQPGAVKTLDGRLQLFAALLDDLARRWIHDDPRGNAQPHVLEPQMGHERRLGLGNIVVEMLGRTAPGEPEPHADIGAGGEAIEALRGTAVNTSAADREAVIARPPAPRAVTRRKARRSIKGRFVIIEFVVPECCMIRIMTTIVVRPDGNVKRPAQKKGERQSFR